MTKISNCKIKFCKTLFRDIQKIKFPYTFRYPIIIGNYQDNSAWTAEITLFDYINQTSNGTIKLLMYNAPNHLLVSGNTFFLSPGFQKNDDHEELVVMAIGEFIE